MHVLAANSVATLLNYLEEQLQHTPTPAQIQGTIEEKEDGEENPEGEGIEQKVYRSLICYRRTILCFKFDSRNLSFGKVGNKNVLFYNIVAKQVVRFSNHIQTCPATIGWCNLREY